MGAEQRTGRYARLTKENKEEEDKEDHNGIHQYIDLYILFVLKVVGF